MFLPEYTITPSILKNISAVEYNRALIDTTTLLQNFEIRLEKESLIEYYVASLNILGVNATYESIKRNADNLTNNFSSEIKGLKNSLKYIKESSKTLRLEEEDIKNTHIFLSEFLNPANQIPEEYRKRGREFKTDPDNISENLAELIDWFNGLDAMDTNPVIAAGIIKAQMEIIHPFEKLNSLVADLITKTSLLSRGYLVTNYISMESFYFSSLKEYEHNLKSIIIDDYDYTTWLEYFTEGMASQIAKTAEKVKLLGKDTKLAKASGKINLTRRQEVIVEHLQDYGLLQNKQFSKMFPNISEDSVLRDLKKLIDDGIIVKRGSTKSSRYELR
ncbi:Fic family protein [Patescibacteria group bacterium]